MTKSLCIVIRFMSLPTYNGSKYCINSDFPNTLIISLTLFFLSIHFVSSFPFLKSSISDIKSYIINFRPVFSPLIRLLFIVSLNCDLLSSNSPIANNSPSYTPLGNSLNSSSISTSSVISLPCLEKNLTSSFSFIAIIRLPSNFSVIIKSFPSTYFKSYEFASCTPNSGMKLGLTLFIVVAVIPTFIFLVTKSTIKSLCSRLSSINA